MHQCFGKTSFIRWTWWKNYMPKCCICKKNEGKIKIKEGNPAYKGKPICAECQGYRKLLLEDHKKWTLTYSQQS